MLKWASENEPISNLGVEYNPPLLMISSWIKWSVTQDKMRDRSQYCNEYFISMVSIALIWVTSVSDASQWACFTLMRSAPYNELTITLGWLNVVQFLLEWVCSIYIVNVLEGTGWMHAYWIPLFWNWWDVYINIYIYGCIYLYLSLLINCIK